MKFATKITVLFSLVILAIRLCDKYPAIGKLHKRQVPESGLPHLSQD